MNDRWSLNELYESFDSEKFKSDLEFFEKSIENLTNYARENFSSPGNEAQKIENYLKQLIEAEECGELLMCYANLTLAVDVMDEAAAKNVDVLEALFTGLTEPSVMAQKFISEIDDIGAVVSSSDYLKQYEFLLNEIKEKAQYMLSEQEEVVISKMETTGSKAWEKLRDQLTATLMVDITIDGEERHEPLTVIRNYANSDNAALRKNAYEAELASYKKIDKSIASCLNSIKGEVLTLSKLRGYETPLDMTLISSRMDRQTLESMWAAIKIYLPVFRKYLKHKSKLLGNSGNLPFYDLFAPVGNASMKFTFDEAKEFVVNNFNDFSSRLGDFAKRAFDNRWVDVYPREGKTGGAFCAGVSPIKESRVMLNFGGTFSDVTTAAHELGHAYHNECLRNESILNSEFGMPIAETASTFCETLVVRSALKTANRDQTLAILDFDLSGANQVIVDIYSRYLFETSVFENRVNGTLSVNDLNSLMLKAQKEAYGDGLDENLLHPYMWACKSHYYYADSNFYNFPYAYGYLFSMGLYAKYLKDGPQFIDAYDRLLAASGKNNLYDLAQLAGINVRDQAFWESSLQLVEDEVEKFINL